MGHPRPVSVMAATYAEFGPRRKGLGGWGSDILEGTQRFDVDDFATAMIRFENGATLVVETSWASYGASTSRLRLFGREAGAEVEVASDSEKSWLRLFTDIAEQPVEVTPELRRQPTASLYEEQVKSFVASIVNNTDPLATPEQALLVTKIIEDIYRSAELGREVTFDN
jgi:predicted dehydrogenase